MGENPEEENETGEAPPSYEEVKAAVEPEAEPEAEAEESSEAEAEFCAELPRASTRTPGPGKTGSRRARRTCPTHTPRATRARASSQAFTSPSRANRNGGRSCFPENAGTLEAEAVLLKPRSHCQRLLNLQLRTLR